MNLAEVFKIENLPPPCPLSSPEGQGRFTPGQSITSGNFAIDAASGIWGFPKDRIIELFGEESCGKTTIALQCAAACTKAKRRAAIIDVEHALDLNYAKALGIDMDYFYVEQPTSAEEALRLLMAFCKADDVGIAILDSVAALTTEMELNGEIGDANIATVARLMSANMKKLNAICSVNETLAIMINQNRVNPGAYGAVYQTGGRALKFYASMRIRLKKASKPNTESNIATSNETEITFVKNKLAIPYTTGTFDLVFGKGADNGKAIIEIGSKLGVIEKKGSWIAYKGNQLAQGFKETSELLSVDRELREQIIEEIKEAIEAKKGQAPVDKVKKKASAVVGVSKSLKKSGFIQARALSVLSELDDD